MARLDIERQKRLEPTRIEYAVSRIQELGFEIVQRDNTQIQLVHSQRANSDILPVQRMGNRKKHKGRAGS